MVAILRTLRSVSALLLLLCLLGPTTAFAETGAISQSYQTSSSSISAGTLVSLTGNGSGTVAPATTSTVGKIVGIAASQPALELSSSNMSSVQIVVGGTTEALVSDANGAVMAGDEITVSPIAGVGMKAIDAGQIVGTALKSLNSVKTVSEQATTKTGQHKTIHVGLLPVSVNISYYSAAPTAGSVSAYIPPFLQSVANAIAGKAVSPLRVLVGTVALLMGFCAVISMLYVAIRSGVISLGRNPLAENALRRGIVDVFIAAIGVLVVTGVIVTAVILA